MAERGQPVTGAGNQWSALLRAGAEAVSDRVDELTALDSVVGDGDHGVNLRAGLQAVVERLDGGEGLLSAPEVLQVAGDVLQESMAGAAGLLMGRFLLVGGQAIDDRFDGQAVATVLQRGTAEVRRLGKASPGDRSMVDALAPASDAALAEAAVGSGPAAVLRAAGEAAAQGAASTAELVPRVGRAARATSSATGRPDAGATSIAIILEAWASVAQRSELDV